MKTDTQNLVAFWYVPEQAYIAFHDTGWTSKLVFTLDLYDYGLLVCESQDVNDELISLANQHGLKTKDIDRVNIEVVTTKEIKII